MYVQGGTRRMLIRCFSHSSPPLSFPLPGPVQLQPLKLQCITRMVRPQRKQYPYSPVTPTRHDGAAMAGYRDIRARTDTQGSTLMARATGGSSKVTYPRKPRASLSLLLRPALLLSLQFVSRATYIYLHTFLSMTESRPPTKRELELLDPAWCVQQTNRRCRSG